MDRDEVITMFKMNGILNEWRAAVSVEQKLS